MCLGNVDEKIPSGRLHGIWEGYGSPEDGAGISASLWNLLHRPIWSGNLAINETVWCAS